MNTLTKLPLGLTRSRGLTLIWTADKARSGITQLIADLLLLSPLFVIAGSEWLPAFSLSHLVTERTVQVRSVLRRLYTARASTCDQMLDSLAGTASVGEPILILDFLHTFCNADVSYSVRSCKLRKCCDEIKRLAFYRPVIVMTQQKQGDEHEGFSQFVHLAAKQMLYFESEPEQIFQPALF